jgi:hypothetical protein
VCTEKPVFAGQLRLVLSSSASSQHLSFVFELTGQATAVANFSNEEYGDMPIPMAARSKARTVFDRSNTRIGGSNPARGMNVLPHFSVLCCPV